MSISEKTHSNFRDIEHRVGGFYRLRELEMKVFSGDYNFWKLAEEYNLTLSDIRYIRFAGTDLVLYLEECSKRGELRLIYSSAK